MNISELSVRRGVTFTMLYLMILGFGLFSLSRLGLDLYPDIDFPVVIVITTYTGSNPEDVETLISRPIEGAVASVKGVEEISSNSKQGISVVALEFDWAQDMQQAETDVRRNLDLIRGNLPADANEPIVFAFDPSMQPILMMMLTGPYPLDKLRQIADDDVAPRMERLQGIAVAEATGGLERHIRVTLDPERIQAYRLDPNQIVAAIAAENRQVPGGYVEQGVMEFAVQVEGKYQNVAEIGEAVVGAKIGMQGMEPIRLKEVADIEDTFKELRRDLMIDGEPAVWLMVRKQSGANTVQAAQRVTNALDSIRKELGEELEFRIIFNQADFINDSLGNLSSTAIMGIVITFFVLLAFLRNIRSALIVATAIPLSVIATFALMDTVNMTLNVLSLAGLALAVGMLVDNGIVVLENIFRLREEGYSPWDGAIKGAQGVGLAITASTLTTIAVFVPVLFVPGIAGVLFKDMAFTICFSLLLSLLVARTFVPLSASRLLGTPKGCQLMDRAQQRTRFTRFREIYGNSLDWTLKYRWVVAVVLIGVIAVTVFLAVLLPTEFMMDSDDSFIMINYEAPVDSNLERARQYRDEAIAVVESVIRPEERKMLTSDLGTGEGFSAIMSKGIHAGMLRIPLVKPKERTRSKKELVAELRAAFSGVSGLTTKVSQGGFSGSSDIVVEIRGHDLLTSREIGMELMERFRAMPELSEVEFSMEDQKPQVQVDFDRDKMGRLGLSTAAVGGAVSTVFMGRVAAQYSEDGDEYDVLVRYGSEDRSDIDLLRNFPIATPGGKTVPLRNIAKVGVNLGPVNISRLDQERVTRVSLDLADIYTDADGRQQQKDMRGSISRVQKILAGYPWPQGFNHTIGGSAEDFTKSMKHLATALLVAIFLVFMVMASQFESVRQPFIVLFSVPLAGIGVVLIFVLTRSPIDMTALLGAIMLVGIVVNNAILMVDAANQIRDEGHDRLSAISLAGRQRLRPVLMTAMTTIFGMFPMALGIGEGAEAWSGLAKAVIGGLVSSTFLTLYVVPTMYTLFAGKRRKPYDTTSVAVQGTAQPGTEVS